jgi:hypothetical protein
MAAEQRIQRVIIDGEWRKFDPGENAGLYLVAVKGSTTKDDVMDISKMKNLVLEIGVDSGLQGHPVPIQRINLKFNEITGEGKVNDLTAFSMTNRLPKTDAFIRFVAFSDGVNEIKTGSMPISINTVTL